MLPHSRHEEGYLPRYLDATLEDLLTHFRAVAIDGPKAVGKTETMLRHVDRTLRVDDVDTRRLIEAQGTAMWRDTARVGIDEWQYYPPLWDSVRREVDDKAPTQFILTGSASPSPDYDTHSGSGRIISNRMRPLSLAERAGTTPTISLVDIFDGTARIEGSCDLTIEDYARQICASGFPDINPLPERHRRVALASYAQRIIDRDIADMGATVRSPASLRAWLGAYAAATATTSTYDTIMAAATPAQGDKPARATFERYRELLDKIWVSTPCRRGRPA